jgi:hypothetical protein
MAHDFITLGATGIRLTSGSTSSGAALPFGLAGDVSRLIRISATVAAHVRIGAGSQTAVNTDVMVQPGESIVVTTNGNTHIAVIQATAAGVVQVSPLENLC